MWTLVTNPIYIIKNQVKRKEKSLFIQDAVFKLTQKQKKEEIHTT